MVQNNTIQAEGAQVASLTSEKQSHLPSILGASWVFITDSSMEHPDSPRHTQLLKRQSH